MAISVVATPERSKIGIMQVKDFQKTPIFCGTLTLAKTGKGMRPQKFMSENRFKKPSEAIEMLRSADLILLAPGDPETAREFLEMLNGYQLSCRSVRLCRRIVRLGNCTGNLPT